MAAARKPHGVTAGTPADVDDARGRLREPALENLAGPRKFDDAVTLVEAPRFTATRVVGDGLRWERGRGVHESECIVAVPPAGASGSLVDASPFS